MQTLLPQKFESPKRDGRKYVISVSPILDIIGLISNFPLKGAFLCTVQRLLVFDHNASCAKNSAALCCC